MRHTSAVALLLVGLALASCDSKSPGKPGNPLPPQKPPAPKTQAEGLRTTAAVWWVREPGAGRWIFRRGTST